jgi:hypothetical protein
MIPDFDENGNLPPVGFITPTIQEFEERFAITLKDKEVRREIFNKYKEYCNYLISLNIASIQWVNGSYTTLKPKPNDIDLVIHFDGMKLHQSEKLREHFRRLIDRTEMKHLYKCHPQCVLVYPQTEPDLYSYYILKYKFWRKWFSRDRDGNDKGLIEFDLQKTNFKSRNENSGVDRFGPKD